MNAEKQITLPWKDGNTVADEHGNILFIQAFIIKRFSRLQTGGKEDTYIQTPVYVNVATGKIMTEGLPIEVKEVADIHNANVNGSNG